MCRSIRTLRPPYVDDVTEGDVRAAARQYVRKLTGFREPSDDNQAAFEAAIDDVEAATRRVLETLTVRGRPAVTVVPGPERPPTRAAARSAAR